VFLFVGCWVLCVCVCVCVYLCVCVCVCVCVIHAVHVDSLVVATVEMEVLRVQALVGK